MIGKENKNDLRGFRSMSRTVDLSNIQRLRQSKLVSVIETFMTVGLGMLVSLIAWPFIGALYAIPYSYSSHFGITALFTVLALVRVYIVRRFFEHHMSGIAIKWAKTVTSLLS